MADLKPAVLQAKLLPVEAVMAQLGVGKSTVFKLIGTNQLRSVKIGRRRLVPQSAVDDLVTDLTDAADTPSDGPRGGDAA